MEDNVICFKRKIYNAMLKWKSERKGDTALLIQGSQTHREIYHCGGVCTS